MATHGNKHLDGNGTRSSISNGIRPPRGSFPGAGGDQWHRTLTGRQSPEPVSARLRMIYGKIVAEKLPEGMLDLLAQLDQKRPDRE
jgi:hypothetical protein